MAKKINPPTRIPLKIIDNIDEALDIRVKTGLMNRKDANRIKGFKLILRTEGWKLSMNELKTKREKKR